MTTRCESEARTRTATSDAPATQVPTDRTLRELRARITAIDREVTCLLARRVEVARRLRDQKLEVGADLYDPAREAAVVRAAAEHAREIGLEPEAVRALFWQVISIARDAQIREGR